MPHSRVSEFPAHFPSSLAMNYRDGRDDDEELTASPDTPLLLSDVPLPSHSLTQSMMKAHSSHSAQHSYSLTDLCLSHHPASHSPSYRKKHSSASFSFSLSTCCASFGTFSAAALIALFVTACVYGVISPLKLRFTPSSSLPLLHLSRNSTDTSPAAAFFPLSDLFGHDTESCPSVPASSWPFSSLADATHRHTAWIGFLSLLLSQPPEKTATQEAVVLDGYSVASFNDLVDVMNRRAGRVAADLQPAAQQQEVAIHIVTAPSNAARRAELDARLSAAGYSEWRYHSSWTRERMVKERAQAAEWIFPAIANASSSDNDDSDIGPGLLNTMEHIAVLQAIAASPLSAPYFAIVLEDVAVLTPSFRQRMAWITSTLPRSFDAVFFGGCLNLHPALKDWQAATGNSSHSVCEPERADGVLADCSVPADRLTPLLIPTVRSRCASGYLVSRRSAARLLAALKAATRKHAFFVPIDHSLNEVFAQLSSNRSTVYQLEPPVSYDSSKIIQLAQPTIKQQPSIESINHSKAVAFTMPQPDSDKQAARVLAPSGGGPTCDSLCGWSRPFSAASVSRAQSNAGADWSSYVSPTSFRDMVDWTYWRHDGVLLPRDRLRAVNDSVAIACLPTGSFIYVQTTMITKFFDEVHPQLRRPYFLITGSADQETPAQSVRYLDDLSADGVTPKLLHWFGQNGNSDHPRFTSIPIGINYHEMGDALDQTLRGHSSLVEGEPYTVDDGSLDFGEGERPDSKRFHSRIDAFHWSNVGDFDRGKWLLANFALDSNPTKRGPPLVFACGNDTLGIAGKPWAQCVEKSRGVSQYVSSMPAVYHHNSRFRFHLSPEGNGLDCHRTWEALYLGVVPIVQSGPLNELLADTPAWIVDDWQVITMDSLQQRWKERTEAWRGKTVERLHFGYWKKRVIQAARQEMETWNLPLEASWLDMDAPRRRCWGPISQRQDRKAALAAA